MRDPGGGMWDEALDMLARAGWLQRQFFLLGPHRDRRPTWEPPADMFETERELAVFVALPGVPAEQFDVRVDGSTVIVRGRRARPAICKRALIHRLEIPYGRLERRIELPPCRLRLTERSLKDGCLILVFQKPASP